MDWWGMEFAQILSIKGYALSIFNDNKKVLKDISKRIKMGKDLEKFLI